MKAPISGLFLIAANVVPLIGVLFFEWDTLLVLALFWIENLIIGLFNLLRMLVVLFVNKLPGDSFTLIFFIVHYGAFCAGHGAILTGLLPYPAVDYQAYFAFESPGVARLFLDGAAVFLGFIEHFSPMILIGLAGLVLSHSVSFVEHFVLRGEMYRLSVNKLMLRPYQHIIVMHIGLIGGALLLELLASPVWLLALIVVLKIAFDFRQHRGRHKPPSEVTNF